MNLPANNAKDVGFCMSFNRSLPTGACCARVSGTDLLSSPCICLLRQCSEESFCVGADQHHRHCSRPVVDRLHDDGCLCIYSHFYCS